MKNKSVSLREDFKLQLFQHCISEIMSTRAGILLISFQNIIVINKNSNFVAKIISLKRGLTWMFFRENLKYWAFPMRLKRTNTRWKTARLWPWMEKCYLWSFQKLSKGFLQSFQHKGRNQMSLVESVNPTQLSALL